MPDRLSLLHEVEGYQHHEIAELLDCSIGNSRVSAAQGKAEKCALCFFRRRKYASSPGEEPLALDRQSFSQENGTSDRDAEPGQCSSEIMHRPVRQGTGSSFGKVEAECSAQS